jgi:hypothetical protein
MNRSRILASILLLAALLALQVGAVLAAPASRQSTPLTGTVQGITLKTNSTTGVTVVLVTLVDTAGNARTVALGGEAALALGLITLNPATGAPVANTAVIGTAISIEAGTVIPGEITPDVKQHPVGSALAEFFSELVGVDYETIMQYHEQGMGFGVIAQALWMTHELEGDSEVFSAILDAKRTGDYSAITMPDGSTPRNWGQFRKALLAGDKKANLGLIMSGRAQSATTSATTGPQNQAHGNGHGHGKNKDHGPKH